MSGPGCPSMAEFYAYRAGYAVPVRRRIDLTPGVELCVHVPMAPRTLAALADVARCVVESLLNIEAGRPASAGEMLDVSARQSPGDVDGGRRGD